MHEELVLPEEEARAASIEKVRVLYDGSGSFSHALIRVEARIRALCGDVRKWEDDTLREWLNSVVEVYPRDRFRSSEVTKGHNSLTKNGEVPESTRRLQS